MSEGDRLAAIQANLDAGLYQRTDLEYLLGRVEGLKASLESAARVVNQDADALKRALVAEARISSLEQEVARLRVMEQYADAAEARAFDQLKENGRLRARIAEMVKSVQRAKGYLERYVPGAALEELDSLVSGSGEGG